MAAESSKQGNDLVVEGASVVQETVDGMHRIADRVKAPDSYRGRGTNGDNHRYGFACPNVPRQ